MQVICSRGGGKPYTAALQLKSQREKFEDFNFATMSLKQEHQNKLNSKNPSIAAIRQKLVSTLTRLVLLSPADKYS